MISSCDIIRFITGLVLVQTGTMWRRLTCLPMHCDQHKLTISSEKQPHEHFEIGILYIVCRKYPRAEGYRTKYYSTVKLC